MLVFALRTSFQVYWTSTSTRRVLLGWDQFQSCQSRLGKRASVLHCQFVHRTLTYFVPKGKYHCTIKLVNSSWILISPIGGQPYEVSDCSPVCTSLMRHRMNFLYNSTSLLLFSEKPLFFHSFCLFSLYSRHCNHAICILVVDIQISRLLIDPACLSTQPIYFTDCPLPKMVLVCHP